MNTIKQVMKKFGYTENETSIYITLLESGNLSGYEVSKRSGVARSKVYNLLENLVNSGLVVVNKTEPKLYHATSSEELLNLLKQDIHADLAQLEKQLTKVKETDESDDLLWKINGYGPTLSKAKYLIEQATESLYIQIWEQELTPELIDVLAAAEQRLEHFVLILFKENNDFTLPFTRYYDHGFQQDKLADFGNRWLSIVSDSQEVLFGDLNFEVKEVELIWTKNRAMMTLAKEYIKHDAYTLKLIAQLPDSIAETYHGDLGQLRQIY
ncbi:helix-turn-helix domain-containing protein [Vagococcus lutrae]|uniref:TrmB family transcriptional regulator n=1 Tax=Vagococcus lutrae TaxID=81947 RepID=UPI00288ED261|nr:helix-turn-helix domain-containing protein [Vagococcus lutrae]MDT2816661.1 helix-turn-helix domain-containing protein [Vagococcus lutrae]